MKIDILCSDGSPLGVTSKTIWGDGQRVGVGGAELGLITMCEAWTDAGYEVVLYNNPHEGGASPFEQRTVGSFDPNSPRDVLITFRSPNPRSVVSKGLKVWWSTDQYTRGSFSDFAPFMDKIVCISKFHKNYFDTMYGIKNVEYIDLPVRIDDFEGVEEYEKEPYRMIFTSVPDRGLDVLLGMYPYIKEELPEVSLVITSDYRLWGTDARNEAFRARWSSQDDVFFRGAIPRQELIKELMKAQVMLYPSIYEELFCISVAEASAAAVYPITPAIGSLETTNMGKVLKLNITDPRNDQNFIKETLDAFSDLDKLEKNALRLAKRASFRFHPDRICKEWDLQVFR